MRIRYNGVVRESLRAMKWNREMIGNILSILLFLVVSVQVILLQFVNTNESCNPENVKSSIQQSLVLWLISLPFFIAFLLNKRVRYKMLFLMIVCIIFWLSFLSLFSTICCHESYGNAPVYMGCCLLLFAFIYPFFNIKNVIFSVCFVSFVIVSVCLIK